MLITLLMNLNMLGPSGSSSSSSSPIQIQEEGGAWHKKDDKIDRIKKQNQEAVILAVSEWLINNN